MNCFRGEVGLGSRPLPLWQKVGDTPVQAKRWTSCPWGAHTGSHYHAGPQYWKSHPSMLAHETTRPPLFCMGRVGRSGYFKGIVASYIYSERGGGGTHVLSAWTGTKHVIGYHLKEIVWALSNRIFDNIIFSAFTGSKFTWIFSSVREPATETHPPGQPSTGS